MNSINSLYKRYKVFTPSIIKGSNKYKIKKIVNIKRIRRDRGYNI